MAASTRAGTCSWSAGAPGPSGPARLPGPRRRPPGRGGCRSGAAAEIASRYPTAVSLYGHVATPDGRSWREDGGDTGLGTSGSGDVLAGVVAGLVARGAEPERAACWAAYAHAAAGQRLA